LGLDQERPIDVQSASLHSKKYRDVLTWNAQCATTTGAGLVAWITIQIFIRQLKDCAIWLVKSHSESTGNTLKRCFSCS
jgi:hypothetical protein